MKAYTKLTVVMRCQIVARKSVAQSSGDRRRGTPVDKIMKFEEKSFSKILITPIPRTRPEVRECVTSMSFQQLLVFFAWPAWRAGPYLKI